MALISKLTAACKGIGMIKCVPLNMSEWFGGTSQKQGLHPFGLAANQGISTLKAQGWGHNDYFSSIEHCYCKVVQHSKNKELWALLVLASACTVVMVMLELKRCIQVD